MTSMGIGRETATGVDPGIVKIGYLIPMSVEHHAEQLAYQQLVTERILRPAPRGPQVPRPVMGWCLAYTRLRLACDPLGQAVLALHQPNEYQECEGCDYAGWEGDPPEWPCRTVELLAEHYDLGDLL